MITSLLQVKGNTKWAREKFRVYGLKRKLIDRFFKKMSDGENKPNIFYGAAKFSPSSKNKLSAPTSFMSSSRERHFRLEYQGRVRQVQGLRRCNSNVCARALLVGRDLNAALNDSFKH